MPVLEKMLENYPNIEHKTKLLKGFKDGFRLEYKGPRIPIESKNLKSADDNALIVREKLEKEIKLGRMAGPFDERPLATLRTSPIGIVPKNDGGWRLITHLSYPKGGSVNEFIDQKDCKVQYTSFDEVTEMIAKLGKGALLGVHDIKSAFRLIPVHRADFDLLGIYFQNQYFLEKCLPMGCSISCVIFETFSTFIEHVVSERSGKKSLSHYLDDYIFGGKSGSSTCQVLMNTFECVCEELNVPIAKEKSKGPVTNLVFLGLEIDTVEMLVKIPTEKLCRLRSALEPLLWRKRVKIKDFESMVGLMAFCSKAITSSRAFMRRFYDILASVKLKNPRFSIKINREIREDVQVWLDFLSDFNGVCYISENDWVSNESLELFSDSSGSANLGCASFYQGQYVQYRWPQGWARQPIIRDITFLELVPIVLSLLVWGSKLANSKIIFRVDNFSLCTIINNRTSKSKRTMTLLRPLVLYTMKFGIQFRAKFLEGCKNEVADSLSRFQVKRFRKLCPNAADEPEPIPTVFHDLISTVKLTDY